MEQLHRDFAHAGSDVIPALTYYGHRAKMATVGRQAQTATLNREALKIAAGVARPLGLLLAGNLSNTHLYRPDNRHAQGQVRSIFWEQVEWAAEYEVDYLIAETFTWLGEALLALEAAKQIGLPAVVTLAIQRTSHTLEGVPVGDACARLEEAGASRPGQRRAATCSHGRGT